LAKVLLTPGAKVEIKCHHCKVISEREMIAKPETSLTSDFALLRLVAGQPGS